NLMLTAMFRHVGFEANPILISTRGNGVSFSPSRTAFDYVISGVELNGQVVLFDATNKFSLPNILPIRDLNWFGRIIRKNGSSSTVDLMPKSNSKEVVNVMAEIKSDGEVTGKMRDQYFDYNGYIYRDNNNGITKESIVERIEKKHQGLEISDYDVQNNSDLTKPIVESFSFLTTNAVEIIGDKMYFSPLLFLALTENPFKQEIRQYPIDFVFPHQDKYTISIKIPEGYTFETVPQSIALALPENLASFKYNISNTDNQIQLTFVTDINQAIIGSEYYEAVKEFFKEMVNKNTEKVVLKKT
ncbi:MAG TPA: transglutaminase, partial [Flavobacterium sp.]|nr:transglutaminase [Flavobacterium sp.]